MINATCKERSTVRASHAFIAMLDLSSLCFNISEKRLFLLKIFHAFIFFTSEGQSISVQSIRCSHEVTLCSSVL